MVQDVGADEGFDLTTKGQIHTHDSSGQAGLNVGSNDQILTADSTTATGLKWADSSGGEVSDYVAFAKDETWATYTTPTGATVSSTKADAWVTVQSGTSNISVSGVGASGAVKKSIFSAGSSALGIAFIQIKVYTQTSGGAGNYRFYFCKGTGNTAGSNQTYNNTFSPGASGSYTLCTAPSSPHAVTTIEAGDYFNLGAYNSGETNGTKGSTSSVTGSEIQYRTGSYGCGATGAGSDTDGQFYLELLQTYASTNLTTAGQQLTWTSTSEANANMVLDYGSSKLQSGVAFYYGSDSDFVQILVQSSDNGTDWTTERTINATQLTASATNYIRYNLVKARYNRIYVNDGVTARILSGRCDGYVLDELQNHTHLEISPTSTTINLDGTTP